MANAEVRARVPQRPAKVEDTQIAQFRRVEGKDYAAALLRPADINALRAACPLCRAA